MLDALPRPGRSGLWVFTATLLSDVYSHRDDLPEAAVILVVVAVLWVQLQAGWYISSH